MSKENGDSHAQADAHEDIHKLKPVDLIRLLSKRRDADIFLYSGELQRESANVFVNLLEKKRQKRNAILIVSTFGGNADAAYIIARYIKRTYKKFTLFVFGYCKSAGTLFALGADEIIMSCRGEFGPLDVQLAKADEIGYRSSGLDISQALDFLSTQAYNVFEKQFLEIKTRSSGVITTKTAGEIASSIVVGLLAPVTSQIDPMKMGEMQRAVNIAYHYGIRLNDDQTRVERLIHNYPSHSFVIDYNEAKELFGNVQEPNEIESLLELHLIAYFTQETGYDCIRMPHPETIFVCLNPEEKQDEPKEANNHKEETQNESKDGVLFDQVAAQSSGIEGINIHKVIKQGHI